MRSQKSPCLEVTALAVLADRAPCEQPSLRVTRAGQSWAH